MKTIAKHVSAGILSVLLLIAGTGKALTSFFVCAEISGWFAKARETVERENPVSLAI